MTGQGDPSSWTESTGTTDPLCQCKKGGSFYTRFQPSRKGWSCLGDLKEKGRNMKKCQILALSKICLFMPRLIISLFQA